MKKILVGIIIVIMLLLQSSHAFSELNLIDENDVGSKNIVESDKPDLIITNIWFKWNPWNPFPHCTHYIGVTIKNIGDEKVDENEDINLTIIVKKWLFVKLKTYNIDIKGGLEPGESKKSNFSDIIDSDYFPGFYKFISYVNSEKAIDESDYLNNDYTERDLYLILCWIELIL